MSDVNVDFEVLELNKTSSSDVMSSPEVLQQLESDPEKFKNLTSSTNFSESSNTSSNIDIRERHQLTFEDDLWDKLPEIQTYHKQGIQMVSGL